MTDFVDERPEYLQGTNDTLYFQCVVDGDTVKPTIVTSGDIATVQSPAVLVYSMEGNLLTSIGASSLTVGDTGKVEIPNAAPAQALGEDYSFVIRFSHGGKWYSERVFFDIVKTKLRCPVSTEDIKEVWPNILDHLSAIEETDCSKFIRRAWSVMMARIRAGGNRPSLILEKDRLKIPALELALSYTAAALVRNPEDLWYLREVKHQKAFENEYGLLGSLKYDKDEDDVAGKEDEKRIARKRFFV